MNISITLDLPGIIAQACSAERLQPLILRRSKSAVARDLPPKTEILHTVEIGKPQRDLYDTIRAAVDRRVQEAISAQGLERSQIIVLDALPATSTGKILKHKLAESLQAT